MKQKPISRWMKHAEKDWTRAKTSVEFKLLRWKQFQTKRDCSRVTQNWCFGESKNKGFLWKQMTNFVFWHPNRNFFNSRISAQPTFHPGGEERKIDISQTDTHVRDAETEIKKQQRTELKSRMRTILKPAGNISEFPYRTHLSATENNSPISNFHQV